MLFALLAPPALILSSFALAPQDAPLTVKAAVAPVANSASQWEVTVDLNITPGWHTYAAVPEGNWSPITKVSLELGEGMRQVGEITRPLGTPDAHDSEVRIFEGKVTFSAIIEAESELKEPGFGVLVNYQACMEEMCNPPQETTVQLELPTSRQLPVFEAPVMLLADGQPMNSQARMMYPSPAIYDVDGDGQVEFLLGNIFGNMVVYEREEAEGEPVWGAPEALQNTEGRDVKVSNW